MCLRFERQCKAYNIDFKSTSHVNDENKGMNVSFFEIA